jgi:hypothetical protein
VRVGWIWEEWGWRAVNKKARKRYFTSTVKREKGRERDKGDQLLLLYIH